MERESPHQRVFVDWPIVSVVRKSRGKGSSRVKQKIKHSEAESSRVKQSQAEGLNALSANMLVNQDWVNQVNKGVKRRVG